jgi:hypothetical protein
MTKLVRRHLHAGVGDSATENIDAAVAVRTYFRRLAVRPTRMVYAGLRGPGFSETRRGFYGFLPILPGGFYDGLQEALG